MARQKILIIDDDKVIAKLIARVLSASDYDVTPVHSAKEGMAAAREWQPHAILCDVVMPGSGGTRVVSSLKKNARTAHIPVILVSGYDVSGLSMTGADAVLQKPFNPSELLQVVGSVTER